MGGVVSPSAAREVFLSCPGAKLAPAGGDVARDVLPSVCLDPGVRSSRRIWTTGSLDRKSVV